MFLNQLVHSLCIYIYYMYIVLTQYRTRSTIRSTYTPLIPTPFPLWNTVQGTKLHHPRPVPFESTSNQGPNLIRNFGSPNDLAYSNIRERSFDRNFIVRIFRLIERSHPPLPSPLSIFVGEHRNTFLHLSSYRAYICIRCSEHCQDRPRGQ